VIAMKKKISSEWETRPFDLRKIAEIKGSEVVKYSHDLRWLAAILKAEGDESLDPLITYLRHPATQPVHLGPGECYWLRLLFERMQIKRKKRGRFTPLGMRSAKQRNWLGAEHVRELKRIAKARGEDLSTDAAIDRVVRIYPWWFAADAGKGLGDYIKREGLRNIP
jgi:hypothetical protein